MTRAVKLRDDYSASDLRRLAARSRHANAARRLLALAAIRDGANRTDAARVGGMDRQTLRDWVHRFNAEGPDGLRDYQHAGPACRLNAAQQAELKALVEAGPDRSEERHRPAMGPARHAATPAGRPALRQCLAVRGDLPGARQSRWPGASIHRHGQHATAYRGNLALRDTRRPRGRPARSRRMAYYAQAQNAPQCQPDLPTVPCSRTEPGREYLAVPTRQLVLQYRL
ncbi:hypothetical protein CD178_00038 [Komagataeibacter saccharivorans]|uniref:Uncharacterized protein n=1 Tax=Komagataeibacter saccharivorans TaxID=265959 RepID=A0A347W7N5_9PROT|nr:hypothetical protein CD178_00038 [Komagataeibacter saccharivorans]